MDCIGVCSGRVGQARESYKGLPHHATTVLQGNGEPEAKTSSSASPRGREQRRTTTQALRHPLRSNTAFSPGAATYSSHVEGSVHHLGHRTDGIIERRSPPTGNDARVPGGACGRTCIQRWASDQRAPLAATVLPSSRAPLKTGPEAQILTLRKSGAGRQARPWPWQSWGWLGGLTLLLIPSWKQQLPPCTGAEGRARAPGLPR